MHLQLFDAAVIPPKMLTRASKVHRLTLRARDAPPAARLTAPTALRHFSSTLRREKPRLLVVGTGWGGYEVMRKVDKRKYDVTVSK